MLVVLVLSIFAATPVMAATQSYKFYYYEDTNTNGTLNVGDICRRGTTLQLGKELIVGTYQTWFWGYVPIAGSNFTITNFAQLNSCKTSSSSTYSVEVGKKYRLKDQAGIYSDFTPAGGSLQYFGLIGGNENF